MPRQQRIRSRTGYYHVMNRGNERKNIFLDEQDKSRFLETWQEKSKDTCCRLHAFCLMDNHFHLMVSEGEEDITRIMKRVAVSYVYYFNRKYRRTGHLFQDRFKSEVVEEDAYALALVRYIHRNPVKAGMVKTAGEYLWSSYYSYLGPGKFSRIVVTETILGLFAKDRELSRRLFAKYMNESGEEHFLDLGEDDVKYTNQAALELFRTMVIEYGMDLNTYQKEQLPPPLIRELKRKTCWSLREIADLTGLNKDQVHRMVR